MSFTKTALLPVSPDEAFALITEPERLRRWQTAATGPGCADRRSSASRLPRHGLRSEIAARSRMARHTRRAPGRQPAAVRR